MKKKKSTYISGPIYGVTKQNRAYYKGKMLRYSYIMDVLKITHGKIKMAKDALKIWEVPKGFFGGPVESEHLLKMFIKKLGLKGKYFEVKMRYFVTTHGSITVNHPPEKLSYPVPDYSEKNTLGFPTRALANAAAEEHYQFSKKLCVDITGKPDQPVSIVLYDKDGNVVLKKNNGFKKLKKKSQ